jgi:aerobic-type carbon monoxide dehydrogenase small subunit (CoxS/CutS family)
MSERRSPDRERERSISRRSFLKGAGGVAAGGALTRAAAQGAAEATASEGPQRVAGERAITLAINGEERSVRAEPRTTLLSTLRTRLEPPLTGAKEVCDRGACGACTVMVDGRPVYSCMQLALDCVGKEITTVEGLGGPDSLSPVQEAFWKRDALMCGFCTPGFVVSVSACLARESEVDETKVRAACSGNLCRCGTYPHVFEAALEASRVARANGSKR